jgi:hypothetical protein
MVLGDVASIAIFAVQKIFEIIRNYQELRKELADLQNVKYRQFVLICD